MAAVNTKPHKLFGLRWVELRFYSSVYNIQLYQDASFSAVERQRAKIKAEPHRTTS